MQEGSDKVLDEENQKLHKTKTKQKKEMPKLIS